MILQVNGGAMLELFWRQPGVRSWTYRTARDFLSRYVTHRDGLRGLRESLAQRAGSQRMLYASNTDVLHRGASLIASGDMVVAQSRYTKRRPGTGQELGPRWNSVLLLRREKLHPAPDLEAALAWLDRIKTLSKKIDEAKQDSPPIRIKSCAMRRNSRIIAANWSRFGSWRPAAPVSLTSAI